MAESVKEYLARIGRKGGKASRRRLTVEELIEAARKAAEARWAKQRKLVDEITKGTKQLLKAPLSFTIQRSARCRASRRRTSRAFLRGERNS